MFRNRFLACLAFWLFVGLPVIARAQLRVVSAPPPFPPQLLLFEAFDENLATLTVTQTVMAEVPVTETRVNAAGVTETIVVRVPEIRQQLHKFLLAETTIRTVGGRELERKEAAKQLKKGQPVILLTPSNKFPEAFKALFRDEAVILEVKALGVPPDLDGVKPEKP